MATTCIISSDNNDFYIQSVLLCEQSYMETPIFSQQVHTIYISYFPIKMFDLAWKFIVLTVRQLDLSTVTSLQGVWKVFVKIITFGSEQNDSLSIVDMKLFVNYCQAR